MSDPTIERLKEAGDLARTFRYELTGTRCHMETLSAGVVIWMTAYAGRSDVSPRTAGKTVDWDVLRQSIANPLTHAIWACEAELRHV